jgi:hypothetical protein
MLPNLSLVVTCGVFARQRLGGTVIVHVVGPRARDMPEKLESREPRL